eukprot:1155326-Pelagomonas_calceolata.AAC.3
MDRDLHAAKKKPDCGELDECVHDNLLGPVRDEELEDVLKFGEGLAYMLTIGAQKSAALAQCQASVLSHLISNQRQSSVMVNWRLLTALALQNQTPRPLKSQRRLQGSRGATASSSLRVRAFATCSLKKSKLCTVMDWQACSPNVVQQRNMTGHPSRRWEHVQAPKL